MAAEAIDAAIARVSARQQNQITRTQLLNIGVNDDNIAYRVKVGRLYRVYRGVYSVGHPPITPLERASAAVLACGSGAALSHRSALCLWGLDQRWEKPFEVIVPLQRRTAGITVHRSSTLARRDLTSHRGIRVTSPARTVLDCAPGLTHAALTRAVNDGRHSGYLKLAALADLVERCPTHPGATRIARCLARPGGPTRSRFEDDFPGFCARWDLPAPLMAAKVCGYTVDALFVTEKLIVELDSWEYHNDRASFENDRTRDADTLAASFGTVRITWDRIEDTPAEEAARLHTILADRRRQLRRTTS